MRHFWKVKISCQITQNKTLQAVLTMLSCLKIFTRRAKLNHKIHNQNKYAKNRHTEQLLARECIIYTAFPWRFFFSFFCLMRSDVVSYMDYLQPLKRKEWIYLKLDKSKLLYNCNNKAHQPWSSCPCISTMRVFWLDSILLWAFTIITLPRFENLKWA